MVQPFQIGTLQYVRQRSVQVFAVIEQQNAVCAEACRKIDVVQHENIDVPRPAHARRQQLQDADLVVQIEALPSP